MSVAMACGDPRCPCGCGAWMGQCARPLPHVIYVGPARLTPFEFEVTAPPLTGVFTFPPSIIMPNDQDDSRNAVTTPAPPPSEPTTRTENEKPVAIQALRPPPLKYDASFLAQEDSVFSRAVQLVAEVGNDIDRDRNERRDAAESAATGQALLLKQNGEILAAIQKADDNNNKNYELLRTEILHLKESDVKQDQRLKEGDARFKQIEDSITELKNELIALVTREMKLAADKIEALEQQLAEAKANDPARQASAPTG